MRLREFNDAHVSATSAISHCIAARSRLTMPVSLGALAAPDLDRIRTDITRLRRRLEDVRRQAQSAARELEEVDLELGHPHARAASSRPRAERSSTPSSSAIETQIAALVPRIAQQKDDLRKRLVALYRLGGLSYVRMLLALDERRESDRGDVDAELPRLARLRGSSRDSRRRSERARRAAASSSRIAARSSQQTRLRRRAAPPRGGSRAQNEQSACSRVCAPRRAVRRSSWRRWRRRRGGCSGSSTRSRNRSAGWCRRTDIRSVQGALGVAGATGRSSSASAGNVTRSLQPSRSTTA